MNFRKNLKRVALLAALMTTAAIVVLLSAASCAKVEQTRHGVDKRLLVPFLRGAIAIPAYSEAGKDVFIPGFLDGPVVRRKADGTWSATWYCQDKAHTATGHAQVVDINCAGHRYAFALATAPVPAPVAPMPDRLVVLSDLEGNERFLESALRKLGIASTSGDWQFGQGHVVVLGDSVDRGRDVFALLWRLHHLAAQAHAAGGAVHIVLGNHEQYMLRGNISRANPEHRHALKQMGGSARAFGADTVIGAWLREQPVVLKLGSVLFTHGGVSPDVVASGLSILQLNNAMRAYWQMGNTPATPSPALDAVIGNSGVTQYRGYFRAVEGSYPAATQADVERMLAHFDASQIVVAHTLVERVKRLHSGHVIAVDVNDDEALAEILVYDAGVPDVVDIGIPRALGQRDEQTREFSLLDRSDRQLIGAMYRGFRDLSRIPQPY